MVGVYCSCRYDTYSEANKNIMEKDETGSKHAARQNRFLACPSDVQLRYGIVHLTAFANDAPACRNLDFSTDGLWRLLPLSNKFCKDRDEILSVSGGALANKLGIQAVQQREDHPNWLLEGHQQGFQWTS